MLFIAVMASNFLSTLISFSVGSFAYQFDIPMQIPDERVALIPAWQFQLPQFVSNDFALLAGIVLGILSGVCVPNAARAVSSMIEKSISFVLQAILYAVPFFILGFVVKMNHDQVMGTLLYNFSLIFTLIACAVFSYIVLIYLVAMRFDVKKTLKCLQNILSAVLSGFGSMSSVAAMPLTILATEKNSQNKDLARAIIPATVNVHLIGDCFAIPIFAFAILKNFGACSPDIATYLPFAAYFVLAKFSVAAVPGGGILVMLPILESRLGFNAEMLSLITTLYILFDPVITSANVLGNGGFALAIENKLKRKTFISV